MPADSAPFTDFSVHVAPTEDGTDVAIFGELDLATLDAASDAIEQAMDAPGQVVVDLRACPFIDSKGVGLIARAAVRLQQEGRHLTLRGVQERVARILDISGLTKSDLMRVERQPKS
jgi:anti-sigma B factor antagonist